MKKKQTNLKISSNKSFGIVFSIFFIIVFFFPFFKDESLNTWALIPSVIFLVLGLKNSKILTPLNIFWIKLGILIGKFVSPIIMGLVFFLVVTPIGIVLKIFKKDLLNLKYDQKRKTYWLNRDKPIGTMKRQF